VYVNSKEKTCQELGFYSEKHVLPENTSQKDLIALVHRLDDESKVHGILVQLPLPKHLDEKAVIEAIDPAKDVDGLHPVNAGKLLGDQPSFIPCTPKGVVRLIEEAGIPIEGKHAVIVGRSELVGKPVALLLLRKNATVTICHSRTKDLGSITRQADILVAAVGKPRLITKDMVKKGAVVIDVGTSRVDGKLVGDVDFDSVKDIASHITPVPGGVGPMTIAMLMENTLEAAKRR
jgi:methylenetetrahydrofolate dehydrogenase (NADP+)/methenyltetrahydrofolate cyclohydrolase